MGRNMAQTPSNSDIRRMPLTIGLLVGTLVSLLPIFGIIIGLGDWHRGYVDDRIIGYANSDIFPRITNVERSVMQIEKDQAKIFELLERQDYARNRQYGELKSLMNGQQEDTKKIINHLLVNK